MKIFISFILLMSTIFTPLADGGVFYSDLLLLLLSFVLVFFPRDTAIKVNTSVIVSILGFVAISLFSFFLASSYVDFGYGVLTYPRLILSFLTLVLLFILFQRLSFSSHLTLILLFVLLCFSSVFFSSSFRLAFPFSGRPDPHVFAGSLSLLGVSLLLTALHQLFSLNRSPSVLHILLLLSTILLSILSGSKIALVLVAFMLICTFVFFVLFLRRSSVITFPTKLNLRYLLMLLFVSLGSVLLLGRYLSSLFRSLGPLASYFFSQLDASSFSYTGSWAGISTSSRYTKPLRWISHCYDTSYLIFPCPKNSPVDNGFVLFLTNYGIPLFILLLLCVFILIFVVFSPYRQIITPSSLIAYFIALIFLSLYSDYLLLPRFTGFFALSLSLFLKYFSDSISFNRNPL